MRRKVYDELIKWKKESNGKVALIIDGARRIGKSNIAEQFAKENYKSYILIGLHSSYATVPSVIEFIMSSSNAQVVIKE